MDCPNCLQGATSVIDTRKTERNEIRRRRECNECGNRFTTYERLESPSLQVEKRNGTNEMFDREKIREGIERACNKRRIESEEIQLMIDKIEARVRQEAVDQVISSESIGKIVEDELKDRDQVAYMRFASVYRSFEDVDSFEKEVKQLKQEAS